MGLYSNNFETARFEGTKNPRHTLRCRQKNSLHYTNFCKIISISINKLAILKLQGLIAWRENILDHKICCDVRPISLCAAVTMSYLGGSEKENVTAAHRLRHRQTRSAFFIKVEMGDPLPHKVSHLPFIWNAVLQTCILMNVEPVI